MLVLSGYAAAYFAGAIISAVAFACAFRMRTAPGGVWLVWILVATTIWSLGEALDVSSIALPAHIAFAQFVYMGATTAPVFFLLFALEYGGVVTRVPRWMVAALMVIPVATITAAFTNSWHHLVWLGFVVAPRRPDLVTYVHGSAYWVVTAYGLVLGLSATVLLVSLAARVRGIYRAQSLATILAAIFPWFAVIAYSVDPGRLPGFDPAITLGVSGAVLTASMLRFRLLDLVPVPRGLLVEEMADGILVVDESDRVLEINPAAMRLLGLVDRPLPGSAASALFAGWPAEGRGQLKAVRSSVWATIASPTGLRIGIEHMVLGGGTEGRHRDLYMLRDITGQVAAERALQEANLALERRIEEVEGLQTELRDQATRDPLTGLHNRRYLAETLERELGRAAREIYPVSVVMLDVDKFKDTNDTCGHVVGDQVLRVLGAELRGKTRVGDISSRYGGDEFVIVLPNTDADSALHRAERLRLSMKAAMAEAVGEECQPTVSFGVATYPENGATMDGLIAAADTAVYAAKAAGRDRVMAAITPVVDLVAEVE